MQFIVYGNLEPDKPCTYSNGSGRAYVMLNDKQFARESKRLVKILEKRKKNERT